MRISVVLFLSGCSATLLPKATCESNAQCQAAFGFGMVCNADTQLCDAAEIHPRCTDSTAASGERVEFPLSKEDNFLVASLFGRTDAHTARYRAVELAIEQVNDEAGLDGKLFNVLHCSYEENSSIDDLEQPRAVAEVGLWLASDVGVPVTIGPAASSLSQDLYVAASQEHGMLIISPSATSDNLTNIDGLVSNNDEPGLFWRTAPPDSTQALAIAADMRTEFDPDGLAVFRRSPSSNVAIIYETGLYGEGLATTVAEELVSRGGGSQPFPFSSEAERSSAVAAIADDGGFDEMLIISAKAEDYTGVLLGAGGISFYDSLPIFITDGGRTTEMFAEAAPAAHLFDNVRGSVPATPEGVVFNTFDASYRARYSVAAGDHSYVAESYDAAWMAIYGHAWATGNEVRIGGLEVARGLRRLSMGTSLNVQPSAWTTASSTLSAGGSIDIIGTSGPLNYDPTLAEIPGTIEIYTVNVDGSAFIVDYIFGQ